MKFLVFIFLSMTLTHQLHAATPFVYSGDLINAVFQSPEVNQAVAGMVTKIEFLGFNSETNVHKIKFSTELCKFVAHIKDEGDGMGHKFVVTTSNLGLCSPDLNH